MGSVESEKYCLKWNDFTSNLSVAFQEMRRDADFFDLTLLTENSEIRCHKLVLGACSSHFRQIIKRLSSQNIPNPAIYLRGVRHEDIKNLLEFMYLGEVNIAHEDLDSFLAVAQDLCIKGLTQDNSTSQNDTSQHTPSGSGNTSSASKRPKFSKNGVEHQQVKKPKREQIIQQIQPKQEPVTHHEIDMSESVGIENVEADVETYDEYYDEDANMDNTGEDSKEQDGFSNDSKFSSLVFEDVSNIRKAAVWQYFHLDRIEHLAKCQFPDCGKLIITKNGMAALLTHLRARHNIDLKKNYRKSTNCPSEDLIDPYNQF